MRGIAATVVRVAREGERDPSFSYSASRTAKYLESDVGSLMLLEDAEWRGNVKMDGWTTVPCPCVDWTRVCMYLPVGWDDGMRHAHYTYAAGDVHFGHEIPLPIRNGSIA